MSDHERAFMRIALQPQRVPATAGQRAPRRDDAPALGALMFAAYAGTVDDEGESAEQAVDEVRKTFAGTYGPYDETRSSLVERDGRPVSACLVTYWQGRPFVAFSLTHPASQRQGLARAGLQHAMQALHANGEVELRRLGFEIEPRRATAADVPGIQRVRAAVKENRLVSRRIGDDEVQHAIEVGGRGWVVEAAGEIVGFAIVKIEGEGEGGRVWALFVDPAHEGRGHGRRLLDTLVGWSWARGLQRLQLSTEPGTRAQRFYARAGWRDAGPAAGGEVAFERVAPPPPRRG
jgi:GNAT superfamily N-acetyltransferase